MTPSRPKVVHLSSVHAMKDVRIFWKECATLRDAGYRVHFLGAWEGRYQMEGMVLEGVGDGKARGRLGRMTWTVAKLVWAAWKEQADLYHFHDPELILAALLLRLKGKPVLYDAHEDLPKQVLSKPWIRPWARKAACALSRVLTWVADRAFDGVVAATPGIARTFRNARVVVVQNYPLASEWSQAGPSPGSGPAKQFLFVGGITEIRGIRNMVRAIALLGGSRPPKLALAGAFESEALREIMRREPGWDRVVELGWVEREALPGQFGQAIAIESQVVV